MKTVARLSSLFFDRNERPRRATIITRFGTVKVEWRRVGGDLCWFSSGILDAPKLAVPIIQRIERLVERP